MFKIGWTYLKSNFLTKEKMEIYEQFNQTNQIFWLQLCTCVNLMYLIWCHLRRLFNKEIGYGEMNLYFNYIYSISILVFCVVFPFIKKVFKKQFGSNYLFDSI